MRRIVICLVALGVAVVPASAGAATLVVNTTAAESVTACGLANAFYAANADEPSGGCPAGNGADTIDFEIPLPARIVIPVNPLQASGGGAGSKITVNGPGENLLTVSGNETTRVFEAGKEEGKTGESGELSLSGLTVTEGRTGEIGAGLYVQKGSVGRLHQVAITGNKVIGTGKFVEGAGIMNLGEVFIDESTISDNLAESNSTVVGAEANGAGITSSSTKVVLEDSTVSGNSTIVNAAPEEGHSRGGGIFIFTLTDLTMRGTTVTGNKVEINPGPGNVALGGGISFFPVPAATIESSTIARNTAPLGADLITEGTIELADTIVAGPLGGGADCATTGVGTVTSLGHNLDTDGSCGFAAAGDLSGVDPLLAPALAANGGPTETLALQNGSPAIDSGLASPDETTDQRGFPRPIDVPAVPNASGSDGTDIGAFEVQVPGVEIQSGPGEGETVSSGDVAFGFQAVGGVASGFLCSLDGGAAGPCTSPFSTSGLANGVHTFTVTGTGEAGYDGTPVTRSFTVDAKPTPVTPVVPTTPTTPALPANPTTPGGPSEPPSSEARPKVALAGVPTQTTKRRLKIRFSASVPGSTFRCRLDGKAWQRCRSPYSTPRLALGKHVFRVKAVGPSGVTSKPVTRKFRVVAPG